MRKVLDMRRTLSNSGRGRMKLNWKKQGVDDLVTVGAREWERTALHRGTVVTVEKTNYASSIIIS